MVSVVTEKNINVATLKKIMGILDLTTLEGSDTDQKVIELCNSALAYKNLVLDMPYVAAVCTYPAFTRIVRHQLQGSDIHTAAVAGGFPSGQIPLSIKLQEARYAIDEGAEEIDMVISRGRFLQGDDDYVFDEIAQMKGMCEDICLKVILETGELITIKSIRKASEIAINAGADFIKTSTGKIHPAATEKAVLVMLDTIREFYDKTGKMVGIKPAGGISELEQAMKYYLLVLNVLGEEWITREFFRIGASKLADRLLSKILLKSV
ncbi:MAG: deoxyribose-phosphate aldolase [Bacteroidetes bacterium]|nr:deoxyribose-phosphate aldolase [Bacteroidota bacterium]